MEPVSSSRLPFLRPSSLERSHPSAFSGFVGYSPWLSSSSSRIRSEEGRSLRTVHQENVAYLREELRNAGVCPHHHTFQADSHNLLIIKTVSDLLDLQVSVQHTPSHIIPVHVGDPILSSTLSDNLLRNHGHYVQVSRVEDNILGDGDHSFPGQAINYPTVARGEEKLRVAPTPHHTKSVFQHSVDGTQKRVRNQKVEKGQNLQSCSQVNDGPVCVGLDQRMEGTWPPSQPKTGRMSACLLCFLQV